MRVAQIPQKLAKSEQQRTETPNLGEHIEEAIVQSNQFIPRFVDFVSYGNLEVPQVGKLSYHYIFGMKDLLILSINIEANGCGTVGQVLNYDVLMMI